MKIISDYWFSTMDGLIGLVIGIDEVTNERKAYIGTAPCADQVADAEHIARCGAKLSLAALDEIRALLAPQPPVRPG